MLIMLTAFSVFSKIGLDWKQVQLLLQLGNIFHSKTLTQAIMTLNFILKLSIKDLQKVAAAVSSSNSYLTFSNTSHSQGHGIMNFKNVFYLKYICFVIIFAHGFINK